MWSPIYLFEVSKHLVGQRVGCCLLRSDDKVTLPFITEVLERRKVTACSLVVARVPDGAEANGAEHVANSSLQFSDMASDSLRAAPTGRKNFLVSLYAVIEVA